MLKHFALVLVGLLLSACNLAGNKNTSLESEKSSPLSWLETADVEQDVSSALEKGDLRLYIVAGRGQAMPGVNPKNRAQLSTQCGIRYIPGVGDVVHSDEHFQQIRKAYQYAETYNQRIAKACLSEPLAP